MPNKNKLSPEYRRAYRERCIAEGRCANCARVRADDDRDTLCCYACRLTKNAGSARRYADQREADPPRAVRADARASFRYGKHRLKNPRRITLAISRDLLEMIDRIRKNWVLTPHYEPYLVSEMVRRILSVLQDRDDEIPCIGKLQREQGSGLSLCFMCDEDNWAVLQRQRERTGCTLPAAVRDCLCYAAEIVLNEMPDTEARRRIWPAIWDNDPTRKGKQTPKVPNMRDLPPPEPDIFDLLDELPPDDSDIPMLRFPDGKTVDQWLAEERAKKSE
jgi:hypothetical protein